MKRFSFHRRGGGILYCQLFNPETGKYLSAKSTGTTDPDDAVLVAARWLNDGIPDKSGKVRQVREVMAMDGIVKTILSAAFTQAMADDILMALRSRGFIGELPAGTSAAGQEKLSDFLRRF